ncbi:unnamed protein product [Penicillium discolor]
MVGVVVALRPYDVRRTRKVITGYMNSPLNEPPLGGTIDHILSILPSLVPSAQRVARICAERPHDVVDMSGADLAEAANTSPATVSRTAQALGLRSFQHLRMLLVRDLAADATAAPDAPAGTEGFLRWLAEGRTALASIDPVAFDAAADAIARAPRLLISGTGASHAAAQASAVAFAVNGRPCEAPADGVVAHLTARVLAPGDVCLIVSSSGANSVTLAVADAAVDAGATAWDQGILGSGLVQLLVLNALQIAVADRMSDAADRARLAVREEVLDIVADDGSDAEASDVPDVIDHGDGR